MTRKSAAHFPCRVSFKLEIGHSQAERQVWPSQAGARISFAKKRRTCAPRACCASIYGVASNSRAGCVRCGLQRWPPLASVQSFRLLAPVRICKAASHMRPLARPEPIPGPLPLQSFEASDPMQRQHRMPCFKNSDRVKGNLWRGYAL